MDRVGDGGQAAGSQLLGPWVLVEGRGHQCVGTQAVFVDSGLVGGENDSHHEQGGQGKDHTAGLEASCQAMHHIPGQEKTLPRQLEQLHEQKQKLEEGVYYATVLQLVLVGQEEATTGVTKLWLKLLSVVIGNKLLVKPLLWVIMKLLVRF